jgi:hypothetical protein
LSAVTLLATTYSTISATFDPKTVNTTGSLVLIFTAANVIPLNSDLIITFPSSLTWTRQISPTYLLNLNTIFTCVGLTANVKANITCSGNSANL